MHVLLANNLYPPIAAGGAELVVCVPGRGPGPARPSRHRGLHLRAGDGAQSDRDAQWRGGHPVLPAQRVLEFHQSRPAGVQACALAPARRLEPGCRPALPRDPAGCAAGCRPHARDRRLFRLDLAACAEQLRAGSAHCARLSPHVPARLLVDAGLEAVHPAGRPLPGLSCLASAHRGGRRSVRESVALPAGPPYRGRSELRAAAPWCATAFRCRRHARRASACRERR